MADDSEILLGRWDCPYCKTKGISGNDEKCKACGATRPQDVQFYLPEDAPVLTSTEDTTGSALEPDWICGCGNSILAKYTTCPTCGAPRENAKTQPVATNAPAPEQYRLREDKPSEPPSHGPSIMTMGSIVAGLIALAIGLWWLFTP